MFLLLFLCGYVNSHIHCYIQTVLLLEFSEEFIKEASGLIKTVIIVNMSQVPSSLFIS